MNNQDILLINQYLENELQGADLTNFEQRLQTDPEFKKLVFSQQFLEWSLRPHPLLKAKQIVETLGDDLWTDDEKKSRQEVEPITYTYEELMAQFSPVEHLESVAVSRSSSTSSNPMQNLVLLPENGIDCRSGELNFDFEEATPFPIVLILMDNREKQLLQDTIESGVYEHTVSLAGFQPGRYYWQLRADIKDRQKRRDVGTAVGFFFVHKKMMPD